jgi:Ca2+/Na+ antiporter
MTIFSIISWIFAGISFMFGIVSFFIPIRIYVDAFRWWEIPSIVFLLIFFLLVILGSIFFYLEEKKEKQITKEIQNSTRQRKLKIDTRYLAYLSSLSLENLITEYNSLSNSDIRKEYCKQFLLLEASKQNTPLQVVRDYDGRYEFHYYHHHY